MGMQLLIVTRSLPFHQLGGMEAVAWDIAKGLAREGIHVSVLTTQAPALRERNIIDGVHVHALPVPCGRYTRQWWQQSLKTFADEYANHVDAVLSISAGAMAIARWARMHQPHVKLYVQAHGTAWSDIISKTKSGSVTEKLKAVKNVRALWADLGYRHFDAFISIGPRVTRELKALPTNWIIGNLPVYEISNGIDTSLFKFDAQERARLRSRMGWNEEHRVVIFASRLHPQKGIAEGLRGFALASKRDSNLRGLVVGAGPQEERLKKEVDTLGLSNNLLFIGSCAREDMPAYLSASDVLLFTTLHGEGLPLNVMEALACGLSCIVSKHIHIDELVTTKVNPRDPLDIAAAIETTFHERSKDRRSRLPGMYALSKTISAYKEMFINKTEPSPI